MLCAGIPGRVRFGMFNLTVVASFNNVYVMNSKYRGARKLMSADGIQYWYKRESGRRLSILEFQDVANQHAMEKFGTLKIFSSDLVVSERKPSKKQLQRAERMQDMFSQLLEEKSNG